MKKNVLILLMTLLLFFLLGCQNDQNDGRIEMTNGSFYFASNLYTFDLNQVVSIRKIPFSFWKILTKMHLRFCRMAGLLLFGLHTTLSI